MDKELVEKLAKHLRETDSSGATVLVNFWDDEIYWDRIAEVAISFLRKNEEVKDGSS